MALRGRPSGARKQPEWTPPPWSRSQDGVYPATTFVQASVTELPFADECFDAAVGNIVIQHVGRPERAAGEFA
jgi:ubiquinone/menaquinone biosynthesis C-methylase UbiE